MTKLLSDEEFKREIRTAFRHSSGIPNKQDAEEGILYHTSSGVDHFVYLVNKLVNEQKQAHGTEERIEEFNLLLKHGEEAYLGEDWWADENIRNQSACEIPLSYLDQRREELQRLRNQTGDKS
ncbi:MAG: hypothetical protein EOO17_00870 [Chloroflexi bacterium]|nr:MAG: hypothetical protein EOO17_00870 [Chloroflexota bacterium]